MRNVTYYDSPLGRILLEAGEEGLCGLFFEGTRGFSARGDAWRGDDASFPLFCSAKRWLDIYFSGREPDFLPRLSVLGGSAFDREIWELLSAIPYGETVTYGEIARALAARRGIPRMAAQAVGGAVGRNPLSIMIPCHRVIGAGGRLGGYAGGLGRKSALLRLENPRRMW